MNYVPLNSSNLEAVAYDADSRTLGVKFTTGTEYHYFNVPVSIFDGIRAAASPGTYFNRYVRQAGYSYRQV